jgi:hypothetical protein
MKHKLFLFSLLFSLALLSQNVFPYFSQKENYGAYLTVTFRNPKMFKDSTAQKNIVSIIERVFEKEGIHITHKEKLTEYKLYINITIRDSLIIEARGIGVGDVASEIIVKKPRKAYKYKNEKEIYNSIRSYIKKYL